MKGDVYQELCDLAADRGLHVELHTDYKGPKTLPVDGPPPIVTVLAVTDSKKRILHTTTVSLATLDGDAADVLRALA